MASCNESVTEKSHPIEQVIPIVTIPENTISLPMLKEMFENIQKQTEWDLKGPMLWGYFFTHNNQEDLKALIPELEKQEYIFVKIFLADGEDNSEQETYTLHIEKKEIHTVNSLHETNNKLSLLAAKNNIDTYDGMDVGPIEIQP